MKYGWGISKMKVENCGRYQGLPKDIPKGYATNMVTQEN